VPGETTVRLASHGLASSLLGFVLVMGPRTAQADKSSQVSRESPPKSVEWIHLTTGGGFQSVVLRTLFAEDSETSRLTADIVPETLAGPAASLGIATKLWFIGLGLTGRVAWLSGAAPERNARDLRLWSLDAEVTFRAPLGQAEPFVLFAGGYSTLGGMDELVDGLDRGLDIDGFNLRTGLGLDYYLSRHFSLRAAATAELLFLARKGVPARDLAEPEEVGTLNEAEARILEADGSSIGWGFDLTLGVGVHF
jgi:hypothetical protein